MQFIREPGDFNQLIIRAYEPGQVTIADDHYDTSIIVTSEKIISNWPPQTLIELEQSHLEQLFTHQPDIIILGVGENLQFPKPQLIAFINQQGIGLEIMDNAAACRTFNVLLSEGRRVLLALLLAREPQ